MARCGSSIAMPSDGTRTIENDTTVPLSATSTSRSVGTPQRGHEPRGAYQLGRVDPAGSFLEGPVDVSAVARWGRRDDPFRRHVQGDVLWAWLDDPGSTTLHVARVRSGGSSERAPL